MRFTVYYRESNSTLGLRVFVTTAVRGHAHACLAHLRTQGYDAMIRINAPGASDD